MCLSHAVREAYGIEVCEATKLSLEDESQKQAMEYEELPVTLGKTGASAKFLNDINIKDGTNSSGPSNDQIRKDFRELQNDILTCSSKMSSQRHVS